jgi:hypothetical protein
MDAAGARRATRAGRRCHLPRVSGAEDEAAIRRIRAKTWLDPRWPSKCISRKQKAAGHVQPPISCVASRDAQAQDYFFFFAFFFFAFLAMRSSCVEVRKRSRN